MVTWLSSLIVHVSLSILLLSLSSVETVILVLHLCHKSSKYISMGPFLDSLPSSAFQIVVPIVKMGPPPPVLLNHLLGDSDVQ